LFIKKRNGRSQNQEKDPYIALGKTLVKIWYSQFSVIGIPIASDSEAQQWISTKPNMGTWAGQWNVLTYYSSPPYLKI
jgi:hypothetical protein